MTIRVTILEDAVACSVKSIDLARLIATPQEVILQGPEMNDLWVLRAICKTKDHRARRNVVSARIETIGRHREYLDDIRWPDVQRHLRVKEAWLLPQVGLMQPLRSIMIVS